MGVFLPYLSAQLKVEKVSNWGDVAILIVCFVCFNMDKGYVNLKVQSGALLKALHIATANIEKGNTFKQFSFNWKHLF